MSATPLPLEFLGAPGSPYARKMRALLRYRLPRLRGKGVNLARLKKGVGARGPGETQLETDRRRVLSRISQLERELKELVTVRETQRKARRKSELPTAALVGYTNAGKSSLLNRLTSAGVLVENALFATLEATVRRYETSDGRYAIEWKPRIIKRWIAC